MQPTVPESSLPQWPASRIYHDASNLGPQRMKGFVDTIVKFGNDCAAGRVPAPQKQYPSRPQFPLPPSAPSRGLSLAQTLATRRTRRTFSAEPASLATIAALLRNSAGLTGEITANLPAGASAKLRAWPSAGGLYPIELYLLPLNCTELPPSIFHYSPFTDALADLGDMPPRETLEKLIFAEGLWKDASLLVILTAVFARTQAKYGERGYRFVHQEAGHLMQNLLLAAEDLQLNAVALGGFVEDDLAALLQLDPVDECPIYAAILGGMPRP